MLKFSVETFARLHLTRRREVAYAFHITDNTREVVEMFAATLRTFLDKTLVDMSAFVAHCVRDIKSEVITAFFRGHSQKLAVLLLCEMFLKVAVQCRAACEVLDITLAVQFKLIENVSIGVFNDIEVAVLTVARNLVAVFLIPFSMFHAHVFRRNHLAVEHEARLFVFFVISFDKT